MAAEYPQGAMVAVMGADVGDRPDFDLHQEMKKVYGSSDEWDMEPALAFLFESGDGGAHVLLGAWATFEDRKPYEELLTVASVLLNAATESGIAGEVTHVSFYCGAYGWVIPNTEGQSTPPENWRELVSEDDREEARSVITVDLSDPTVAVNGSYYRSKPEWQEDTVSPLTEESNVGAALIRLVAALKARQQP